MSSSRLHLGHLMLTLRSGEAPTHVPAYVDLLVGAARPVSHLDGGPLDAVLGRSGGFRASGVFHARASMGRVGEQHSGFGDLEEELGLSRAFRVELADEGLSHDVVARLRSLHVVESATVQTLSLAPCAQVTGARPLADVAARTLRADIWAPHERISAARALGLEPGDERVTVAVIDTGVALGHPELRRKLLAGYDCVDLGLGRISNDLTLVGDSRGRDFTPADEVYHGSHVAGVIGAQGWHIPPGLGGRSLMLPVRVLAAALPLGRSRRVGVGGQADISAGMKLAVDMGAHVINMSFGTPGSAVDPMGPRPHADVVRYAARYGCILVAAAGNAGDADPFFPAALPEVIAVGSVDASGRRSPFSSYGDHLALCAPGEGIVSLGLRGYLVSSGTSHAAPFVSGTAALMLSRARRTNHRLTAAEVKRLLMDSASPLGDTRFSPHTGSGLLDAFGALAAVDRALAKPHSAGGRDAA